MLKEQKIVEAVMAQLSEQGHAEKDCRKLTAQLIATDNDVRRHFGLKPLPTKPMSYRKEEIERATDQLLKILREAIDAILPATNAWPETPVDKMKASMERESLIRAAMSDLGHKLSTAPFGWETVSEAVTQVCVVRGVRAETIVPGDKLTARNLYEHGQPAGIELRASIVKE